MHDSAHFFIRNIAAALADVLKWHILMILCMPGAQCLHLIKHWPVVNPVVYSRPRWSLNVSSNNFEDGNTDTPGHRVTHDVYRGKH